MKKIVLFLLLILAAIFLVPVVSGASGVLVAPPPTPSSAPVIVINRPVYTVPTTTAVPIGAISISSVPSGAQVTIDGAVLGTTPYTNRTLAAGSHTLLLTMVGYQDYTTSFTITADQLNQQTYTLVPVTTTTSTTVPAATPLPTTALMIITATPLPTTIPATSGTTSPSVTPQPPLPVPTPPVPSPQIPGNSQSMQANVCHYDPATFQCAGICPLTGTTCIQVNESSCAGTTGTGAVKCGCVDTSSPVSLAAAGLLRVSVNFQPANLPVRASGKGPLDAIFSFINGIVNKKQALNTTEPLAYTQDTSQALAARATGACPPTPIRSTSSRSIFPRLQPHLIRPTLR